MGENECRLVMDVLPFYGAEVSELKMMAGARDCVLAALSRRTLALPDETLPGRTLGIVSNPEDGLAGPPARGSRHRRHGRDSASEATTRPSMSLELSMIAVK